MRNAVASWLILAFLLAMPAPACDHAQLPANKARKSTAVFQAGPGLSGSWFESARNGEGFILEILPDGSAVAAWFTFPAQGEAGDQMWLVAPAGRLDGNRIAFPLVYRPRGGVFGPDFDPGLIQSVVWGSLEFEFHDCNFATARYSGPAGYGSGTRTLTRITTLDQLDCAGTRALTGSGARALAGLRSLSGNWYVATRSGEGWFVEDLPGGRAVVYWFTFDPQGRQAWTVGIGTREGNRLVLADNSISRGTHFGAGFDPADVEVRRWGRLEFTFNGCNSAGFSYASELPGYGSGTRAAQRVTQLASAPCIDGTPQPRVNGNWVEVASMPAQAQSELAATTLDGKLYAVGGFGDLRGLKRYDPASNGWTELADLPGGRHHLAAFAIDGGVYAVGGEPRGGGDSATPAFRYDVAADRWDPAPQLTSTYGSHAAILNGRAYVGSGDGSLEEFDPRTRKSRRIPAPDATQRDHSQVVAFLGEIWMLGGRFPETRTVAIYDPVAERWRAGPPFRNARGGFAAAVVDDQILLGGGEFISGSPLVDRSVEIYTAGMDGWRYGPNLAVAVHGVPGVGFNGRFYVVSGSTQAGQTTGATGRIFYLEPQP